MFKFVEDNVNGVGIKWKLSVGLCDICKRCYVCDIGLLCLYFVIDDGYRNVVCIMI